MMKLACFALLVLVSCSSSSKAPDTTKPPDPTPQQDQPPSPYIDGFNPPPVQDGFTRYVLPPIRGIQPGTDRMWCQYIDSPATDQEYDIVSVTGAQSKGGHHAVLYATTAPSAVGTTADCKDAEMINARFLGGIGGEGASSLSHILVPGAVFRMPTGSRYMANVHYINTTDHPIDGQGVIDVKIAPKDPTKRPAFFFTNVGLHGVNVPPGPYTLDVKCTVQKDVTILVYANHMHELGTSAYSQVARTDGSVEVMQQDRGWTSEMAFNPTFATWTLDKPMVLHSGDIVTTHCEWNNTTNASVNFPTEMCASFGFYLGDNDIYCIDNRWRG
jgi:hypothetical protein